MTNLEKYRKDIEPYVYSDINWSIKDNKIMSCEEMYCPHCRFKADFRSSCSTNRKQWLQEEYKEPTVVDWSKVAVDTPVIVSNDKAVWFNRYFAKYEDDRVYVFCDGATSWSNEDDVIHWNFTKLAEKLKEGEKNND